jgi:pyruvate,orthophosphate dikinase
MCDIEFTIESGRLWLLQVRVGKRTPEAALRLAVEMADDPTFPLTREAAVQRVRALLSGATRTVRRRGSGARAILVGLPASPGIASGPIATTLEAALRFADEGWPAILVREETSPEDVPGMARSAGVLTARGGLASHAAVVARGWGIPAVVGADGLRIEGSSIEVSGDRFATGDTITVDGGSGKVFRGVIETVEEDIEAARTLREWATDLGIAVGSAAPNSAAGDVDVPAESPAAAAGADADPDACLRAIGIKGMATADAVALAVGGAPAGVAATVNELIDRGFVASTAGAYRLTTSGTDRLREIVADERSATGPDVATGILDEFLTLDREMKEVVTAWQVRAVTDAGEPLLNDHADPAYDEAVLGRLARLSAEVDSWLASVERRCARLGRYRTRLTAAAGAAASGDTRYLASARVDSFHGAWFELHEDLILLAGRTREEEVAAGRA